MQQTREVPTASGPLLVGRADDPHEIEAERFAGGALAIHTPHRALTPTLQRQPRRPGGAGCLVNVCWVPIQMFGLGRVGLLHGIVNLQGSGGRRHHLEIDPTQHMPSSGGAIPTTTLHSHVADRSGWNTGGTCTPTPVNCAAVSRVETAAQDYEVKDVEYNPASGPNSNSFPDWVLDQAGIGSALGTPPAGARQWDFYRTHPGSRSSPPTTGRPHPATRSTAAHRYGATTTLSGYVALVRAAERELNGCGVSTTEQKLIVLSGLYYGPTWSRDFSKEHSQLRNEGFAEYTAHRPSLAEDPRACLRDGLYEALQGSQDITVPGGRQVDVGHLMIGLNSRTRTTSFATTFLAAGGATGLAAVTWVGDLGGATARLAIDRTTNPRATEAPYFTGNDYGAPSNLEGDVAASVLDGTSGGGVTPFSVSAGSSIADEIDRYFRSTGSSRGDHYRRFLELAGAVFSGTTLTNRATVEASFAARFENFAPLYVVSRYAPGQAWSARSQYAPAAAAVAKRFVDWLLARLRHP
jgi:hypothetical protein